MAPDHRLLRRLHRQRAGPPVLRAGPRGSEGGDVPRPGEGLQRSSADLRFKIFFSSNYIPKNIGLSTQTFDKINVLRGKGDEITTVF
jgi:hypothetical protein